MKTPLSFLNYKKIFFFDLERFKNSSPFGYLFKNMFIKQRIRNVLKYIIIISYYKI